MKVFYHPMPDTHKVGTAHVTHIQAVAKEDEVITAADTQHKQGTRHRQDHPAAEMCQYNRYIS